MIQKKYHMILPILTIMYITFIAALKCNLHILYDNKNSMVS